MGHNPFAPKTEKEIKDKEKVKKEIELRIKTIATIGQRILSSPDGISYKQELEKQRDSILKLMILTVDPDPLKDAFFVRACLNKLSVVYALLESVERDARTR